MDINNGHLSRQMEQQNLANNKTLIIVWEFPPGPGGIGKHAYSFSRALADQQFDVTILTSADYVGHSEIEHFDKTHANLNIIRVYGWFLFKYINRFFQTFYYCLKLKPEHVICSGRTALWLTPFIQFITNNQTRISVFLHGSEIQMKGLLNRYLTYYSLRLADRIYCVSSFTKSLLPYKLQMKRNVFVLSNGLNLDILRKNRPHLDALYSGSPTLLTVGQLTRRKGQHRVINALPELVKIWPKIVYHMVGIETNRAELAMLAKKLGVERNVFFHGRLKESSEVYNAYSSTDVFIMLSENQDDGDVEGFGIAILEANFFGQPAVGARGCGIEDAIKEGVNGYLVDGDNAQEIHVAVMKCLERRGDMESGIKDWVKDHDWNQLILRFLE